MTPLRAGDVVTGFFTDSVADKARPVVVVSSETHDAHRPDVSKTEVTRIGHSSEADYRWPSSENFAQRRKDAENFESRITHANFSASLSKILFFLLQRQ